MKTEVSDGKLHPVSPALGLFQLWWIRPPVVGSESGIALVVLVFWFWSQRWLGCLSPHANNVAFVQVLIRSLLFNST